MEHPIITSLIVIDLLISMIYVMYRGMSGRVVAYTPIDGILGAVDAIFVVWGILVISGAL